MSGAAGRVLFLNPSLYAIGGMQAWLAALMPDLGALGWEVGLALPAGRFNDVDAYLAQYPYEPCVRVENPTGTRLGRLLAVERALRRLRPDVLIVANIAAAYPAIRRMRARGAWAPKVAACVHTLDPGIFADLERFAGVLDGLVAPNRLIAAAGIELAGLAPERVWYAPYRVDVPGAPPPPPADAGPLELAFVHRLDQRQKRALDLPPLVAALRRRGLDFHLRIVGFGEEEERLRVELAAEEAAGRVIWIGAVAPAELRARALGPERALLVLSRWEMGPIVAWQAMAWGSPVVSARYVGSGLEGVLRDGENALLFDVGDVEGAATAIARLAADRELRARLAAAAWRDVGDRFSQRVATAAWDAALRAIVAAPPLGRPPAPAPIPPAGRLDRWFGVMTAERVRRVICRPIRASGPGDEWPHAESRGLSPRELMARLAALDGVKLPAD
ncbi:MAG TPA: glycosyltransferase family 4 protein [Thermohalobaculum sp.]|nr:glycosyltransferase family 4 protein [Thermohalobaculum sp.]